MLLHFGAVDQTCTVWVNGARGRLAHRRLPPLHPRRHRPPAGGDDVLEVRVRDLSETGVHARGKQRLDRGKIWYTAQSGIWQTVWLETVPASYVERLVLTPHLDRGELEVTVVVDPVVSRDRAREWFRSSEPASARQALPAGVPVRIPLSEVHARGRPTHPHLYDVEVTFGEDRVTSYAATALLRRRGGRATGMPRLLLNGEPVVHVGVLDQGYWPDGLLTPPSDDAMVHDIETMKSLGFTMLRKHAKVEPLRWYAHCDRLGDARLAGHRQRWRPLPRPDHQPPGPASGLGPGPAAPVLRPRDAAGRAEFRREVRETVELLRNTACVAVWTPFNEGWGQFEAQRHRAPGRRPRPHAPGQPRQWLGRPGRRRRPQLPRLPASVPDAPPRRWARPWRRDRRVVALTEYGGFSLRVEDHDWSSRKFGYRHFDDAESLAEGFVELHQPLADAVRRGSARPSTPSSATSRTSSTDC